MNTYNMVWFEIVLPLNDIADKLLTNSIDLTREGVQYKYRTCVVFINLLTRRMSTWLPIQPWNCCHVASIFAKKTREICTIKACKREIYIFRNWYLDNWINSIGGSKKGHKHRYKNKKQYNHGTTTGTKKIHCSATMSHKQIIMVPSTV